jgi:hypothetical protein
MKDDHEDEKTDAVDNLTTMCEKFRFMWYSDEGLVVSTDE